MTAPADSRCAALARRCVPLLALLVMLWDAASLLLRASRSFFWYDELMTFHLSSLHPFAAIWKALQLGVDGMPAGYYLFVQWARQLPADPHVTLRLPSLLGYLLTLACVYWFARKRLPAAAGLAAVLLVSLSPFREFAVEGRSYALLVGCLAVAAVCWQELGERRMMTPLFGLFLTLAVACHPLAIVTLSCFVMAELAWSLSSRRVRWGAWCACAVATAPFWLGLPGLLHYRVAFAGHFWSRSKLTFILSTYADYLVLDPTAALVLLAVIGIAVGGVAVGCFSRRGAAPAGAGFTSPEIVLIASFLFYPVLLVSLTTLLGAGYTSRYGWPGILGLSLGLLYLLRGIWAGPVAAQLIAALLLAFAVRCGRELQAAVKPAPPMEARWLHLTQLSRGEPGIPVVIGSGMTFVEAVKYAPAELRPRLLEVIGPAEAARLTVGDTVDRTNLLLSGYTPLRVEERASFEAAHPRFLFYSGGGSDWMTPYLLERKYSMRLLAKDAGFLVYLAER